MRALYPIVLSLLSGLGCSPHAIKLTPELKQGAAFSERPSRILVAPPTCGSLDTPCSSRQTQTVDNIVRGALEFHGYSAIAPGELVLTTRARKEVGSTETTTTTSKNESTTTTWSIIPSTSKTESSGVGTVERTAKTIELVGSTIEDMPPKERAALLKEANADGVVVVRLIVGAKTGLWDPSQSVEVVVKLSRSPSDDRSEPMVWAVRCIAPAGTFTTADQAVESAARCAVSGLQ